MSPRRVYRNGCTGVAVIACAAALGAQGASSRQTASTQTIVLQQAPSDRTVAIPKDSLTQYFKDMDIKQLQTLRLLEGRKYNVNIRRITNAETALVHPQTIDVWVVLEGSGTLTTGGTIQNGKIVGGQSHLIKAGDVEFIPATVPHGVSGVKGSITWLNIRWDTDWKTTEPAR
ncbi:MAG: cupin domain-containing protein [Acidimicrobiia bacterium]|nr:cupin domain-containing protein [Acidimicrobiia bacterium]